MYVLDARSGSKLAEFTLDSPISSSPVIAGNNIIVATEGKMKNGGVVYVLDNNGNKREILDLRNSQEKVQAALATDGTLVFVHTSTGKLYAINVQTGSILWTTLLKN